MDKEALIFIHNEVLLKPKEKVYFCNIDIVGECDAKQNKPGRQNRMYSMIYIWNLIQLGAKMHRIELWSQEGIGDRKNGENDGQRAWKLS